MQIFQTRRDFLASVSAATATGVLGTRSPLADAGPPETTTIRLWGESSICEAPSYITQDLLRAEGFTDVRYLTSAAAARDDAVARGEIDFTFSPPASVVVELDAGEPVIALGGLHAGCYELFAHEPIRTISDLKGHSVGTRRVGSAGYLQLAIMAAHVGLDPRKDINWVTSPTGNAMELFAEGKVDAFIGFPPQPQELRARKIGRVILSTTTDRPWSQYLCCIVEGNRAWVRDHPIATKRFLRALFKGADLRATAPETAARRLVEGGFTERYDYAFQTLAELPYGTWREFDPEDSMRFYALRLHEVGMISSNPNALLAEGTDWRFFNELKRELKA